MNGSSKTLINLLRGWPNPSLLPSTQIKAASGRALSNPNISNAALSYGPDAGHGPLRDEIATWLSAFYNTRRDVLPEQICITGGASQNLACILQVYSDPIYTRNIWMVSPTYFLACRIFEDSGFAGRLRSIPEDEEGIDIDTLVRGIQKSEEDARSKNNLEPKLKPPKPWSKIYRHIIYAVPTFSNPSSKTMSLKRREEVVRVAREYDALIITDDVYDQLQWPKVPQAGCSNLSRAIVPRIVDVDRSLDEGSDRKGNDGFGNAISNGSFSKIVGPGCRTGWADAATIKFAYGLSQVGSSRSGGAPSQLAATFMSDLLSTGALQDHITSTLQPAYARRYRNMIFAIETHLLPLGVTLPQPNREIVGGYFIWLSLPAPLDADEVAARVREEEQVIIAPGSLFGVYGDTLPGGHLQRDFRLCFSYEEETALVEGVRRIASIVSRMLKEPTSSQSRDEGQNKGSGRDLSAWR